MKGQVYRINFPDGHFYIGSTTRSLKKRLKEHQYERLNALKERQALGYASLTRFDMYLAKYGWNNPTITTCRHCNIETIEELLQIEFSIIKDLFHDSKCLNDVCRGIIRCHTEEQKLCWLERQFCRLEIYKEEWREFWINKVLENWFLRPGIYGFREAMKEFVKR
jgi:hypothetical protein